MPELPDITLYIEALERRVVGRRLDAVRIRSPFLVRTYDPPLSAIEGKTVREIRRLGKRIVFGFDDDFWLILHLMIAGRLHWKDRGAKFPGKGGLAALDFENGTLLFTESGSKHRASLHLVRGAEALREHDPGGLDVFAATAEEFAAALRRENHTLKRALTDPRLFDGIGNAYSDEILHRAKLSPFALSRNLPGVEVVRLFAATKEVLREWIERFREQVGDGFPEKVTAFRPEMAVHGKFGKPCPVCRAPVQRIRYADNETNYCPRCQTEGRILADRSLSRLLRDDWPGHLDEL
ncbi:MAG TPA: DNA-formamidopyrimidine glycosylase family protein [Gemmataceae bacterium]|nr:DNA-formamidopyrimidine glycosylase family protein [Gemmataceae bacterium]